MKVLIKVIHIKGNTLTNIVIASRVTTTDKSLQENSCVHSISIQRFDTGLTQSTMNLENHLDGKITPVLATCRLTIA
jgi:calcineurin-like phosphoesterase